jgi:type I restriction enzyme S subunit
MITFPKYESYKDSTIEWMGKVPSHWEILPFKALFTMSGEKNGKNIVGEMLSVSGYRGIEIKPYEYEEQKREAKDLVDYRVVRPGQLVVNTMWLNYSGLGVSDLEGHVSPAYRAYWISEDLHGRFIHYLLRSHPYIQGYTSQMQGIRPNSLQIKNSDFNRFPILIPSFEEQKRIAEFLDRKTAEIDEAIAHKQRLIELLQEQKAILINQAVTKGLNPDVPMCDSGVEWIGEIPAHWVIAPMYSRFQIELGKMLDTKRIRGNNLIPYLRNTDIQWGAINTQDLPEMDILPDELSRFTVKPGDLLVCEGGDLGRCAIWNEPELKVGYQKALHRVRPIRKEQENIQYLFYVMRAASHCNIFSKTAKPNTIAHLTRDMFKGYRFPKPPKNEQELIVEHLDFIENQFNQSIGLEEKGILKLIELKNTLISHSVTGKIKV